jgi:hypothetical protein
VHVVVAWYQAGRGNAVGCGRQLEKAARRLSPYAPVHRGVAVETLLEDVADAQERVGRGSLDLAEPEGFKKALDRDAEPPVAVEEEQQP